MRWTVQAWSELDENLIQLNFESRRLRPGTFSLALDTGGQGLKLVVATPEIPSSNLLLLASSAAGCIRRRQQASAVLASGSPGRMDRSFVSFSFRTFLLSLVEVLNPLRPQHLLPSHRPSALQHDLGCAPSRGVVEAVGAMAGRSDLARRSGAPSNIGGKASTERCFIDSELCE